MSADASAGHAPRPVDAFGRVRYLGLAVLSLVALLFWLTTAESWRWAVLAATFVMIGVHLLVWRAGNARLSAAVLIAIVIVGQTAVVAVTGGIESPLVPVLIVPAALAGMLLPRPRQLAIVVAVVVAIVAAFGAVHVAGVAGALVPVVFDRADPFYGPMTYGTLTVVVAMLCGGVGVMVWRVQRALERSYRERELLEREAAVARRRELLGLTGAIAHELKNPLAAIQGLSTLFQHKLAEDSPEREQIDVLVGEARRMRDILEHFLHLSRPLSTFTVAPVDLAEVVRATAVLHEPVAGEAGVSLAVGGHDRLAVSCDRAKLTQILVNLLINAIEASPSGTTVTVDLSSGPNGAAIITVTDQGHGLAEVIVDRLYEPGATTKSAGSGLGLTIARSIAEQHGGSLTLANVTGGGCRATLTLPAEPPADRLREREDA